MSTPNIWPVPKNPKIVIALELVLVLGSLTSTDQTANRQKNAANRTPIGRSKKQTEDEGDYD